MTTPRGLALIPVVGLVLVLTVIVAFTITISGQERQHAGKQVHNQTLQNAAESALQYGKAYLTSKVAFAVHADGGITESGWNDYLAFFVDNPALLDKQANIDATIAKIAAFDPKLIFTAPSGQTCFVYARDDMDEFPPAVNDPRRDNNQFIYVGAVCTVSTQGQNQPLVVELSAPLVYAAAGKY